MNDYLLEGLSAIGSGSLLCGPEERLNHFSGGAALLTITGNSVANQPTLDIPLSATRSVA